MGTLTRKQRGVTLVESMISLLIFLTVSLGWMSLEANLARTSGTTQVISQAVFVGQSQLDHLRNVPFEDLGNSDSPNYFNEHGLPTTADQAGLVFGTEWQTVTPDNPNLRRVTLTVSWNLELELQDSIQLILTRAK